MVRTPGFYVCAHLSLSLSLSLYIYIYISVWDLILDGCCFTARCRQLLRKTDKALVVFILGFPGKAVEHCKPAVSLHLDMPLSFQDPLCLVMDNVTWIQSLKLTILSVTIDVFFLCVHVLKSSNRHQSHFWCLPWHPCGKRSEPGGMLHVLWNSPDILTGCETAEIFWQDIMTVTVIIA